MSHPSLEILVRQPDAFSVWKGPPFDNGNPQSKLDKAPCTSAKFSENGSRLLAMKSPSSICIYDCSSHTVIQTFEIPSVLGAAISPLGTYLQTFQKSTSPQDKNVSLWKIDSATAVYQHFQKNMSKTNWPLIQFSSDETVACRMATNEIQFFDASDFTKGIIHRLRVPGVAAFTLSLNPGSHVSAYIPESKGIPASIQIFSCNKDAQSQAVARRSFFRCSTVQMKWNRGSTGLLVVAVSDVDKSNQSYYGESKLNYLTTDGLHEGLVPLRKEGPVHDVQWSYSGSEFAVVYGYMPAKVTIFDRKCNPLLELGTGSYNTIRWNPKGKFICVAGFGNLPGDMAFWDYSEKKLLGTTRAEWSVTSEWSPDGCYFMTATTAPRLQVDNGIKIFYYNGSLYYKKMFDKLYEAEWRPVSPEMFGDITGLINSMDVLKIDGSKNQGGKSSQASTPSVKASSAPPQKPAAYRPPSVKELAASRAELCGGVGASEEMSKNALKNKKRREKQKEKKAAEAASAGGSTG